MEISRPNFGRQDDGEQELITAVIQDYKTRGVLRVVWMNRDALLQTLENNRLAYFSTSTRKIHVYGETENDFLEVSDMRLDEDGQSVLIFVNPIGSSEAGHTHFSQPFFIEGGMESDSEKRKRWEVKWVDWEMHPSLR